MYFKIKKVKNTKAVQFATIYSQVLYVRKLLKNLLHTSE